MDKILAGSSGKINLQMIRTEKPRGKGCGMDGSGFFLSKSAESGGTEGRRGKTEVHEAMYVPLSGETKICLIIGVSRRQRQNSALCAFMSVLPEDSPEVVSIWTGETDITESSNY